MRKRSNKDNKEHGNADRWLLSYSDMITLLMACFIMMYSMSILNLNKFREAAFSIRSGFGGIVKGQGHLGVGQSGTFAAMPAPITGDCAGVSWRVVKPLVQYVGSDLKDGIKASIGHDARGIVITMLSDRAMFASGSAEIEPSAYPLLDRIANTLKQVGNQVQIEGHTCNIPPRDSRYATNWELSTARATNVLRYMVEKKGLDSWRFSAAGYGAVRPVAPNNSEKNRIKNRRVEIVILRPANIVGANDSNNENSGMVIRRSRD